MANNIYRNTDFNIDWTVFQARLKSLMDSRGYSLADLSRKSGLAVATLSRYFYNRTPDLTAAWMIADAFDISIDWLVGRSDTKYNSDLQTEAKSLYDRYLHTDQTDRIIIDTILAKYEK